MKTRGASEAAADAGGGAAENDEKPVKDANSPLAVAHLKMEVAREEGKGISGLLLDEVEEVAESPQANGTHLEEPRTTIVVPMIGAGAKEAKEAKEAEAEPEAEAEAAPEVVKKPKKQKTESATRISIFGLSPQEILVAAMVLFIMGVAPPPSTYPAHPLSRTGRPCC